MKNLAILLIVIMSYFGAGATPPRCHTLFSKLPKQDRESLMYLFKRKWKQMSAKDAAMALPVALSPEFIQELRTVAEAIMLKFPPDRFFIVGIGRSPAPVVAWLQATVPEYASNLPFVASSHYKEKILKIYQEHRYEHFNIFFPSPEVVKGRTVVLVDYAFFGKALSSAKQEIEKYLFNLGQTLSLEMLALTGEASFKDSITDSGITNMVSVGPILSAELHKSRLKSLSEYPSFIPGITDSSRFRRNKHYRNLVDYYRSQP